MSFKQRCVAALLRVYPAEWRAEYGGELGHLLATRPISVRALVNVAISGIGERARSGDVWHVAAFALFVCTCVAGVANNISPWARERREWYDTALAIILFLTGLLTVAGGRRRDAASAAAKAALVGYLPEIVALILWSAGLLHPLATKAPGPYPLLESRLAFFVMSFPTTPRPEFAFIPIAIALVAAKALAFGFAGGLVGRAVNASRALHSAHNC
jgi:hypothetical protein